MSLQIRSFAPGDTDAVVLLWQTTGLTRPWNNPYQGHQPQAEGAA